MRSKLQQHNLLFGYYTPLSDAGIVILLGLSLARYAGCCIQMLFWRRGSESDKDYRFIRLIILDWLHMSMGIRMNAEVFFLTRDYFH